MMQATQSHERFRFGIFEADFRTGELTKRGQRVRMQEQPFQLLAMLLDKPGQLVTREELHRKLWPQTIVDFDHGLNKAISKVREALGDSAENPRFIETVARRGYRFLAEVAVVDDAPAKFTTDVTAQAKSDVAPDPGTISGRPRYQSALRVSGLRVLGLRVLGLASVTTLAGLLAWNLLPARRGLPAIHSLAVMPLKNLSGDTSQDYFADGMTDELITHLGQINTLRVISRTSAMTFKDNHKPLPEIARELNVEAVVEGSVLRSGDRVRIIAQLIRVPDDTHMWAQSYEGDIRDTLALQSSVARSIAEQIRGTLKPQEQAALEKSKQVNPDAYEAYLKGRYFWNKRTGEGLKKAIEYFSRAIEKDPGYAEAYSGLADAYALSGDWEYGVLSPQTAFREAKAASTKALVLDDTLGEAHTSLAFALDLYGWNWKIADAEYKLAIKLNPGYATAHQWYASHLMVMGQTSEAILELRNAKSLDPLSLIISSDLADMLCVAHRFDEAVQESQKTLEIDPGFAVAHYVLGQAFEQKHMPDEAIAEFKKAIDISGHSTVFDSSLAHAYAVSGRTEEAIKIAKDLESRSDQNSAAEASIALIYVGLGNQDRAMAWLDKAYDARFNPSILLRPAFDPLRDDPRFKDLLRRIGMPT